MEFRLCPDCHRVFASQTHCPDCHATLTLATPGYFLGETFGKFRLDSVLGAGGMGVVYLAEQMTLRRKVALKLILPHMDDIGFRRRFLREARVLAEIRHPNVVEIFDFDVNQWGLPFYVMEYLEGRTLRALLSREGPVGFRRLLRIMKQTASGLAGVHRKGIVHRDLKPANIFLARYDGVEIVKVLDFGIAKAAGCGDEDTRLTRSGAVVGTVNYLAPEQLLEEEIGPAVDQYALALVCVELLTGKAVRAGKTMARIISKEISRPVDLASLGSFPRVISEVIQRATMPDPQDRFPDIEAFVEALGTAAADADAANSLESEATLCLATPEEISPQDDSTTVTSRPSGIRPSVESVAESIRRKGVTSRASGVHHAVRSPRRWLIPILAVVFLVSGLVFFLTRSDHGSGLSGGKIALRLEEKVPVPLDCSWIIGYHEGDLMMAGMGDLVIEKPGSDHAPTRSGINPDDVLATAPDGSLLIRRKDRVELGSPTGQGFSRWADALPESDEIVVSKDACYLVKKGTRKLEVFKWNSGVYEVGADIECGIDIDRVVLGTRLAAVVGNDTLKIFSLETRELKYEGRVTEAVGVIAFAEDAGLVALAGWFDSVRVINLEDGVVSQIQRRPGADMKVDLEFLDGGSVLAIGEHGGLMLWKRGRGVIARWDQTGALVTDLCSGSGRLLALDAAHHEVLFFSLGGIVSERRVRVSDELPWAILADPGSERLLIGLDSGMLKAVSLDDFHAEDKRVHTQGITSLVGDGERIASASDDKTIAVWRLPELEVEWRSRAHDYLVNRLFLSTGEQHLWSTSSDGRIKKWSWPELEEEETIDTGRVFGRSYPLHALWVSPDEKTLLTGTWARRVNLLRKDDSGDWEGQVFPFDSEAGYAIADLNAVDSLILLGANHPFELALYDFVQEKFFPLAGRNQVYSSILSLDQGRRALIFGDYRILDFRFRRLEDGRLSCRYFITRHRDLGLAAVAALLPENRVAVVNTEGVLHIISIAEITGEEISHVVFGR